MAVDIRSNLALFFSAYEVDGVDFKLSVIGCYVIAWYVLFANNHTASLAWIFSKRMSDGYPSTVMRDNEEAADLVIEAGFRRGAPADPAVDYESKLAELLWHLTDGRMSGTGYDVKTMVQEVEATFERNLGGAE